MKVDAKRFPFLTIQFYYSTMNTFVHPVHLRLISHCLISDYLASFCNDAIFRLQLSCYCSSLFAQMLLILY